MAMFEQTSYQKKALRAEYTDRINRVIDYVETNLTGDLSLGTLSKVARFSPYHFHRIFKAMVGETLSQFIQRRRVEKAAQALLGNPYKSITEVALDCGFSGSQTFARVFREVFGVSASVYRSSGGRAQSKICKTKSNSGETNDKIRKDLGQYIFTMDLVNGNQTWRCRMKNKTEVQIEVKNMPKMHVAYVRHIGDYKGNSALFASLFGKLCAWAGPRGLIRPPDSKLLSVYYDDPQVTDSDKLRVDVCITVPEGTKVGGEIGSYTIESGTYAVGHFEVLPYEYEEAWGAIMGGWLPESGYQCDDKPCYELYLNDPNQHPEGRCLVDICVPVKPL